MKKLFSVAAIVSAAIFGFSNANAQAYKTGLGIMVDVGDGGTLVGPHVKHFFNANGALEADVLFGSGVTAVQALYQYNSAFPGASGLNWYVGAGPGIAFGNNGGDSEFYLTPTVGLDYKIGGAPLAVSADWRPKFFLSDGGGSSVGRFGLGFKFTF